MFWLTVWVCGSHYIALCCFNPPCPICSCLYCSNDWNFVLLSVVPLVTQMVKNLPVTWETQVRSVGREAPLEKGMATHSTLAWRIPWTEEPGGLQSMGSQRGRHDWATNIYPQYYFSFSKCLGYSSSLFFHANFRVSFLVSKASSRYFY